MKEFKEQQKAKQKFYYDRGTKNLPELLVGDHVRFKHKTNTWTQKANVLSEVQPRSYTIQTEDGALLRRNRRDLLKEPASEEQRFEAAEQSHRMFETPSGTQIQEQTPRRSSRNVKPPERLIEQI